MKKYFVMPLLCAAFILSAGESYNFYMVSDTHFGTADSFAERVSDAKRYRADKAMPVYREVFADMAKKSDQNTKFMIHVGDVIEGNAKDDLAQQKEFEKAIAFFKEYFKFPVYYVRGNHETSGGKAGYINGLLPEISRTAGKKLKASTYAFRQGEDLFIFVDCYSRGWAEFIEKTLDEQKSKPRYVFVTMHEDRLVPFRDAVTQRIFNKLAGYKSVVLHGHTHCTLKVSQNVGGKVVTGFVVGTCLGGKRPHLEKPVTDFNKQLVRIYRQAGFNKNPAKKAFFDKESVPYITGVQDYSKNGRSQGYAKIFVSDEGVYVMAQSSDLKQAPVRIDLIPAK